MISENRALLDAIDEAWEMGKVADLDWMTGLLNAVKAMDETERAEFRKGLPIESPAGHFRLDAPFFH